MFKNKRLHDEQLSIKKWLLFLVIGSGILLFLGRFIYASPTTPSSDKTSLPQIQKESTQEAPSDEALFLAEYDPNTDTFFNTETGEERPLWQEGGILALKLALVLVVVYLSMTGLRWLQKGQQNIGGSGATIRVLETTSLAPGRYLHLVVVGEKTLLIGATDQQFTMLAELAQIIPPLPDDTSTEDQASPFEEALQNQQQKQFQTTAASEWEVALNGLRASINRFRDSGKK